jgi:hypothetical protein
MSEITTGGRGEKAAAGRGRVGGRARLTLRPGGVGGRVAVRPEGAATVRSGDARPPVAAAPAPGPRVHEAGVGVRGVGPTTPLQPLPPIGGARTRKVLTQCEDAVLALLTLEPRLASPVRRGVLRLLAHQIHPSFDPDKVGMAVARLKQYHARGWLDAEAFVPAPARRQPSSGHIRAVVQALVERYGPSDESEGLATLAGGLLGPPRRGAA